MAKKSAIEWTEATWNPITGCSVESPGCKHCYAMQLAGTRLKNHPSRIGLTQDTAAGPVWTGEVRLNAQWLDQPLLWKRPARIFVCAHTDLFHPAVPDEWIDKIFAVMALSPQHTFQVLTKRSLRMREYIKSRGDEISTDLFSSSLAKAAFEISRDAGHPLPGNAAFHLAEWPLPQVWLGVSVEDQKRANQRITDLLATPASVRWVSGEPLLEEVTIFSLDGPVDVPSGRPSPLHWVVVGGESGPNARPMNPKWAQSLRDQCEGVDVPFLFKQWGEWGVAEVVAGGDLGSEMRSGAVRIVKQSGENNGRAERGDFLMRRVGKKAAGRLLDGVLHDGYPEGA